MWDTYIAKGQNQRRNIIAEELYGGACLLSKYIHIHIHITILDINIIVAVGLTYYKLRMYVTCQMYRTNKTAITSIRTHLINNNPCYIIVGNRREMLGAVDMAIFARQAVLKKSLIIYLYDYIIIIYYFHFITTTKFDYTRV